jgi:hypothetical protein
MFDEEDDERRVFVENLNEKVMVFFTNTCLVSLRVIEGNPNCLYVIVSGIEPSPEEEFVFEKIIQLPEQK